MHSLIVKKLTALLLVVSIFVAVAPAEAAPPAQAPTEIPSVSSGQALFSENCMPCHGATGRGDGPTAQSIPGPLPDMSAPTIARAYVPAGNFDVISNGRMDKLMPPWKNQLSEEQIWDTTAFVWSLGTSSQIISTGKLIYSEQCAACHGVEGDGSGSDAPAGINDFTDLETMVQTSQTDLFAAYNASEQHAGLDNLSEDDIWASLDYVRTFSFAMPERNGVLTGQVINAATGKPVGNIELVLHAFQNNTKLETLSGKADEDGNFRFENLTADHTVVYVVEGLYQDIGYISEESAMFLPDSDETTLNLEVYDTTADDTNVNVTQMHYLLSFSPDAVNVLQIFIVGNSGDKTYVGQNGQTFQFTLPENATAVNFQNNPNGERIVTTNTGYADTSPVMPGTEGLTIAAMYDIPFSSDTLEVELPLDSDTGSVDVLMTKQGAILDSDQVDFVEDRDFQGNTFAVYNGRGYEAGDTVILALSGLDDLQFTMPGSEISPPAGTAPSWFTQDFALWTILGLGLAAVLVAAVAYPSARSRLTHQSMPEDEDLETRRQRLVLTLVRLDETFEAGELDETVYHRARARYKAELAQLMEQE
jgi:mono/diheme cytochrome c family protein